MNKVKIKKKKGSLILYVQSLKGQAPDNGQIDILAGGSVRNIAAPVMHEKGSGYSLAYEAPGCIPLKDCLRKPVSGDQFTALVKQVLNTVQSLSSYGLISKRLLLDIRYVLVDGSTGYLFFIYVPLIGFDNKIPVNSLLADITRNVKFIPGGETPVSKEIMEYINKSVGFLTNELSDILRRSDEPERGISAAGAPAPPDPDDKIDQSSEPEAEEEGQTVLLPFASQRPAEPKKFLSKKIPSIIRELNNEAVQINLPRFRIGKDPAQSDYAITGNNRISRCHAVIETSGRKYFISDNKSTNGTFVDGVMLKPGQKAELRSGASIRLADENFAFSIVS